MEHVRWLGEPTLRHPTVIVAFTGWNDAGDAASSGVQRLIEGWQATPLGEIDPEEFTDFATVRPHVRLDEHHHRTIVWPTVGIWSASTPGGDVILMLGPEPALRWRLFCEQILGVVHRYEASMVITLGALLTDIIHTRPTQVMGTAFDDHLAERFELGSNHYEGPTGIVGVLSAMCAADGVSIASLWAAVPAYAAQIDSPKAAIALVERAAGMVGCPAPLGDLYREVADYERRVDALVESDRDVAEYVRHLEEIADEEDDEFDDDDRLSEEPRQMSLRDIFGPVGNDFGVTSQGVSPEGLVAEVEQFLRDQDAG